MSNMEDKSNALKNLSEGVYFDEDMEVAFVRGAKNEIEAATKVMCLYLYKDGYNFLEEIIPITKDSIELIEDCFMEEDEEGGITYKVCPDDTDYDRFFTKYEMEHLEDLYIFRNK